MQPQRWKTVERLIRQIEGTLQGTKGRLVLAIAPEPLEVVLYETPVLVRCQPPQNPLRGFIQEAVSLLEQPTAPDIAKLLCLPVGVVELVLGDLQQMGGVISDMAGRWRVPEGAPRFETGKSDPPVWRRTRRLLCYWPKHRILLPVLPRMRLRDLVELHVHKLQGELAEWYQEFASWSEVEGLKRGRSAAVQVLRLRDEQVPPTSNATESPAPPDAPVPKEEVLVCRCRLDVIALTWASFRSGVWEINSRLWSRPAPPENSDGVLFAPGEPFPGLALLEPLLVGGSKKPSVGESKLDDLAKLFSPNPEAWRALLDKQDLASQLRRDLDSESPALLVAEQSEGAESRRWIGLKTSLGSNVRLICWTATQLPSKDSTLKTE